MNPADPNLQALEIAAQELATLLPEFVLVGGCTVGLLISDLARPPVRATIDVDLLTEVAPTASYYRLCERLRALGFRESMEIICRWHKGNLVIDVMPTDEKVLGFTNRWYDLAVRTATTARLPSGLEIRHVTAPLFIATKLESFRDRGGGDYLHHDVEDILNVVDGRAELADEVLAAPPDVRAFIEEELDELLANRAFVDQIPLHLHPEQVEQARAPLVVERLRRIAGL